MLKGLKLQSKKGSKSVLLDERSYESSSEVKAEAKDTGEEFEETGDDFEEKDEFVVRSGEIAPSRLPGVDSLSMG